MEPERIVFVSSELRNGMMGGLEGADAWCTELANNAGLEGEFMAWLSTQVLGPGERMSHFQLPYRLRTGQLVADSWSDLSDGSIAHPIDRDEHGNPGPIVGVCSGNEVWTNTNPDGMPNSTMDCDDWSSEQGTSTVGTFSAVDASWSLDTTCNLVSCLTPLPLYCVQQ